MPQAPEESPPEGSSAPRERTPGKKSDRRTALGAFVLLALAFGFAAWQITRGSEETNQVAVFAVAITMVTALLQTSLPLHTTAYAAAAAFFIMFSLVVGGSYCYGVWRAHRTIDVFDGVELEKSAQGMAIASSTTVTVHLQQPRSRLRIQLRLDEHNPQSSSCSVAGQTTMRVRLNNNGNIRVVQDSVAADKEFKIDLGRRVRKAQFDVTLLNDADRRCVLNLSVPVAKAE